MQIPLLHRIVACLVMVISLCSCAPEVQPKPKHQQEPKKISSEKYLLNLSLAKFELDEGASYKDIKQQIEAIEGYSKAGKPANKKPDTKQSQTIVVIEFKRKHNHKSRLLTVPLQGAGSESEQFLKQATDRMQDKDFVTVSVKVAGIEPPEAQKATASKKKEQRDVYAAISHQIDKVMKSKQPLALLDEARLYIHLCDFFMQARIRDAAYISMENAKQALALASEKQGADKEAINLLVERINTLEVELHKNMPFTI